MGSMPDKPRVFNILNVDAHEITPSACGSIGKIYRAQGIEAVWVSKQDEEIDSDWSSQPEVDLLSVVEGKISVELERSDLAPRLLEPGELLVLPPDTCRQA